MALKRGALEVFLVVATLLKLGVAIQTVRPEGWTLYLAGLGLLTCLACWSERVTDPVWHAVPWKLRGAATQGVMLGALLMPWAFVALTNFQSRQGTTAGFGARALQDTLAASCAMLLCLALWTMPERCSRTPAPLLVEDTSPAEESPCPSAALSCHCAGQDPPPTPKRPHINPVSPILATRLEDLGLINAAREATAGRHVDLAGTSTSGGRCFAGPDMLERLPPGPIWTQSPAQLNHTMSGVPLAACTEQPAHQIPHDETSHEPDDSAGSSPASGSDSGQSSEEDGAPDTPPTSGVGSSARQAVSRGKLLGKARWQHILLMAAAGTLLVLSICAPPSASHNPPYQVQWESLHQHAGCLPTAPGLSASRARGSAPEGWGPPLDSESGAALTWGHLLAFKRTEAAGAAEGLNEGDSGWTSDRQPPSGACSIRQSYRAVWTSSALRAAANASLSTGGMHLMLAGLPHSFTVGEAMRFSAARHALHGMLSRVKATAQLAFQTLEPLRDIILLLPLGVLVVGGLAAAWSRKGMPLPRPRALLAIAMATLTGMGLVLAGVVLAAAWWTVQHALDSRTRVAILAWWVVLLAAALPAMDWASRNRKAPTIIIRKGYHLLAMGLFLPALFLDPPFLALALSIALALLILIEAIRVAQLPYLGAKIHGFMTSFIDARDSGLLLISHFSLLLGMAVPIWLTVSLTEQHQRRAPAPAYAGIIILGLGDSAASVLGRAYGRHRITTGNRKTMEGTCSGAAATMAGFLAASVASCLLEAATTQLDNVFIPLHHFAMLAA
ncbi:hypothetical protein WJX84_005754 [Apatococcus fuscideae]|uniref:dolichol kinase n=1 Tax=Apatococcus fuscideae TaxID=2026836 RepID=A0AAW1TDE8_9CHLO